MKVALEGKRAIVTGAAEASARPLPKSSQPTAARVAYTDIDIDEAKKAAAQTPGAIALQLDIANEVSVAAAVSAIAGQWGGIDILVNNAGVNTAKHRVNIDEFPREEWDRIVGIDLTGTYLVTQAVARVMISKGEGRIVNISSVLGVIPSPAPMRLRRGQGWSHPIDSQLGDRTRVPRNPGELRPRLDDDRGHTESFLWRKCDAERESRALLSHIPLGRPGAVEDMAHAVLFSWRPESGYITGQVLSVDGGLDRGRISATSEKVVSTSILAHQLKNVPADRSVLRRPQSWDIVATGFVIHRPRR